MHLRAVGALRLLQLDSFDNLVDILRNLLLGLVHQLMQSLHNGLHLVKARQDLAPLLRHLVQRLRVIHKLDSMLGGLLRLLVLLHLLLLLKLLLLLNWLLLLRWNLLDLLWAAGEMLELLRVGGRSELLLLMLLLLLLHLLEALLLIVHLFYSHLFE